MSLLWFRRKRDETKRDAEVAADATVQPRSQTRSPLRIRHLLLLNLAPADTAAHIETAPPLGSRDEVIRTIGEAIPGIRFDGAAGEAGGDGHRVTVDIGRDDPVHAAVATAEGDAGLALLQQLLERTRWRAYAPREGKFIEPDALDLFALSEPPGASPVP